MAKIDLVDDEATPETTAAGWQRLLRALVWWRRQPELTPFQRCLAVHILSARPRGGFS
jgi:hypothetical protein